MLQQSVLKKLALYVLYLFLKREDFKVFFKRIEAFFLKTDFLEVLKITSICIRFNKKSWKVTINDFILVKVTGIQLICLQNTFFFYYYHSWRYNNFHRESHISCSYIQFLTSKEINMKVEASWEPSVYFLFWGIFCFRQKNGK